MEKGKGFTKPIAWFWFMVSVMVAMGALRPQQALAQDPPRTYWKHLSGGAGLPLLFESISGNSNPFDPSHNVQSNATFDATVEIAGYARTFPLFDRPAVATIFFTMGRLSSDVILAGNTIRESTNGFGDPMLELNINVLGPPAQKSIPDMMRYEPGFSVDLVFDLALPIGDYDSSKSLNIGQNRWYGRVGAPIVWQLGPWVPGRRTTLELLPAVWLFGNNDNFVGKTLETDPLYQFDAHLTRDLYERAWASVDVYTLKGGQADIDGVQGSKLNTISPGFTLGYEINDNMNISFTYKSTVSDSSPEDLRMDMFMVTLVTGWHPIIEGSKRLKSEK